MSTQMLAAPSVRPLLSHTELVRELDSVSRRTRYELLSAMPEGDYSPAMLRTSWGNDAELLDRGVDLRVVYPMSAIRRPEILEYLSQLTSRGARIRVRTAVPSRVVISDRRRAITPDSEDQRHRTVLLVSGSVLVRALYAEFLDLWRTAMPVGFSAGGLDVEMVRQTVTALADGLTDEAAARKNGWSVRTYRRRIAAVMDLLGVSTRFEAGVAAREQGWI